jgi:hypothetical protein
MRQRIETPSININKESYFRPSVMISRLRRITRVADCMSSRIAISSGASVTNRLSFRVSGLAAPDFAVIGRGGMSGPNLRLIIASARHVRTVDRGSQMAIGHHSRTSDSLLSSLEADSWNRDRIPVFPAATRPQSQYGATLAALFIKQVG